ncbi:hypothetical protein [Paenibacillus lutrae]|uniref:DUF2334 domain-containing protein n=1 Tax=Paenibacillus lutrae TaxID=2078573 RepID=A0A7X3FJ40_9BACL|nr:hypothetical protein [Paenibacillus lutrae]MVP00611.1 hypothetical protein [Paenibacillus lutrae]
MLKLKAFRIGLLVTLACVLLLPASPVQAAGEQKPAQVLLLYDSLAKGTPREGNVTILQRLLASYRVQVRTLSIDQYKPGTLSAYTKVITVMNASDLKPRNEDYVRDMAAYAADYLHVGANLPLRIQEKLNLVTETRRQETIQLSMPPYSQTGIQVQDFISLEETAGENAAGTITSMSSKRQTPFSTQNGPYAYVPYFEQGNLSELAMASVLKKWLGIETPAQTFLVFKEVYPFSDLELLEETADRFYEAGIPFAVSVRPVFSNTDFPAMKRYLEALKYVQSKNGTILVNAPVVYGQGPMLDVKMAGFIAVLAQNGLAPLGIGAELYWSYDNEYTIAGLSYFNSAVLFPDEKPLYTERTDTSKSFSSSLYSIKMEQLQQLDRPENALPVFPMDTAVTYNFFENKEELREAVLLLKDSRIPFADYKSGEHQVTTDEFKIASRNGVITINGNRLNLNYTPQSVSDKYEYEKRAEQSLTDAFNIQNKIFIALIIVSLIIFGGFLIAGYRLYKRKYLK